MVNRWKGIVYVFSMTRSWKNWYEYTELYSEIIWETQAYFVFYLWTLSIAQIVERRVMEWFARNELQIVEGNISSLTFSTMPIFSWKDWVNHSNRLDIWFPGWGLNHWPSEYEGLDRKVSYLDSSVRRHPQIDMRSTRDHNDRASGVLSP